MIDAARFGKKRNKAEVVAYVMENGVSERQEVYDAVDVGVRAAARYVRELDEEGVFEQSSVGTTFEVDATGYVPEDYSQFIDEELLEDDE